jgi:hypothetical protein
VNGVGRFRLARFERWVAGVTAFEVLLTDLGTSGTFLHDSGSFAVVPELWRTVWAVLLEVGSTVRSWISQNTKMSNVWNPLHVTGAEHYASKPVPTPNGVFVSATAAAQAHGLKKITGTTRARRGWCGCRYL